MERQPWFIREVSKDLIEKSIKVENFKENIEKKHSHKFGGFKELLDKKTRIEFLIRDNIRIKRYNEKFESKILHEYSILSQQLPLLGEIDSDGLRINFCDLHNLPDRSENSIDLLAIKHSTFEFLYKIDLSEYGMNYLRKRSYSVDYIGRNKDQEFQSLTNGKMDKRMRRLESNIRNIRQRKCSMLINEVLLFNP